MANRHDLVEIRSPKIDQNGYLVADAFPTRTGVFKYVKPDGTITRELRHPVDVSSPESLESLKNRPIVDEHPDGGPMDANNTKRLSVGHVGEQVGMNGGHVKANLVVTDASMIAKIQGAKGGDKKNQLSCGYSADVIEEAGTFKGEKYDHRQTNIVYNHLASVWKGRAGPTAQIHLDAEDAVSEAFDLSVKEDAGSYDGSERRKGSNPCNPGKEKKRRKGDSLDQPKPNPEETMTIKMKREAVKHGDYHQDAFEVQFDQESEQAVNAMAAKLDAANAHIETLLAKSDGHEDAAKKAKGEHDQKDEELEALKKKGDAIDPEKLDAMADERADVKGVAHHLKVADYADKSNGVIKTMIVKATNPDLKMDDMDPMIVEGRYQAICDGIRKDNKSLESLAALKQVTSPVRQDGDKVTTDVDDNPQRKYAEDVADLHTMSEDDIQKKWAGNSAQA